MHVRRRPPRARTIRRPSGVYAWRRAGAVAAFVLLLGAGIYGASATPSVTGVTRTAGAAGNPTAVKRPATQAGSRPPAVTHPVAPLAVTAPAHPSASWTVTARVNGQPAAWLAQHSGVTLMRFDQHVVHLTLHAGSSDGGVAGWTYGDRITPREVHMLIAGVNGGFKLTYHDVGFMSGGHVAAPLTMGLASIVTYTDGATDIGAWRAGVPSAGRRVFSVLQNQQLLVDRAVAAATVSGCITSCWGETISARTSVARSALGITADGQLVWAAGEELLPADLAAALISAGAVRAIELDINPDWVAGYLYVHHPGGPLPVPVVPGQVGIAGELLEPDSRDFLAFVGK